MAEVKVLIRGYAYNKDGVEHASSTTTLIKDNGMNVIVDPGMNRGLLLKSLKKENLSLEDVNFVILTHTHIDHCLLAGIFEKAKIIDNSSIYSFEGTIKDHDGKIPGTNVEIINTPGHDQFHCSVLVNDKKLGKVVIAADVFWWPNNEQQKTDTKSLIDRKDPYVKNESQLIESRKKILKIADWIIPGHGEMFKVKK